MTTRPIEKNARLAKALEELLAHLPHSSDLCDDKKYPTHVRLLREAKGEFSKDDAILEARTALAYWKAL